MHQAKRRKTNKLAANDPARIRMEEIMEACFDTVEDVDNEEEGHQCCGLFYKLPSKRDYPEYCESKTARAVWLRI